MKHAKRRKLDKSPRLPSNGSLSVPLKQLWQELPTDQQRQTLQTLGRIIAQQLAAPLDAKSEEEVAHEQD